VIHALKTWRYYLKGSDFTIVTDHRPNTFFDTQVNLSRRQTLTIESETRWSEFLSKFKLDWEYRPGRTNVVDPLSQNLLQSVLLCFIREKNRAGRKGLQNRTRRGANNNVSSVKVSDSGDSGSFKLLELFREGYGADAWFRLKDNLVGLESLNEDGFWYLDNRVVVSAGKACRRGEESHDLPYSGHFEKHKVLHQVLKSKLLVAWLEEGCGEICV
jgi:hypothetical protein